VANLDGASLERDLNGLNGASQVGRKHAHDPVVPPSIAERTREAAALSRELARKPPRCEAALVVTRDRMRLENEFNGHRRGERSATVCCGLRRSLAHGQAYVLHSGR
jgi:hypothetical protein